MKLGHRLVLLLACTAIGAGIGGIGLLLTGDGRWFLALPAVVALGWLRVADPTRCEAPPAGRARPRPPADDTSV